MTISLKDTKTITDISALLYDFLPANPHPYGDQSISFGGCAAKCGIGNLWAPGSKKTAVSNLLQNTLIYARGSFCKLMLMIVRTSLVYRNNKGKPIAREEIEQLNEKIVEIGFKIPELWDVEFLLSLRSDKPVVEEKKIETNIELMKKLKADFFALNTLEPHARGYAFQDFLNSMFNAFALQPKKSFRIVGEEIDGSFLLGEDTYLLEAKWQSKQSNEAELLIFSGKVSGKATWSRGLFISYAGFTAAGLEAFARGKQTNLIGMDAQDIYFILEGKMSLETALKAKARVAAETNSFFTPVFTLANH